MPTTTQDDTKNPTAEVLSPNSEPVSEAPVVDSRPNYSIFTTWEKRSIVLGAAAAAFFSPLTAQIYLPALNLLAVDFSISESQANLTVTTYMVRTASVRVAVEPTNLVADIPGFDSHVYWLVCRQYWATTCLYDLLHYLYRCQYWLCSGSFVSGPPSSAYAAVGWLKHNSCALSSRRS